MVRELVGQFPFRGIFEDFSGVGLYRVLSLIRVRVDEPLRRRVRTHLPQIIGDSSTRNEGKCKSWDAEHEALKSIPLRRNGSVQHQRRVGVWPD